MYLWILFLAFIIALCYNMCSNKIYFNINQTM